MKWIIRLIGFAVVLVLVALVSVFFLPADRIGAIAADQIRKATGRDVTLTGVSMTLWPVLGVRAQTLQIGNADWSNLGPMLEAEDTAIGVDLLAYVQDQTIRVTHIETTRPVIRLESRKDGRASWVFDETGAAQAPASTPDTTNSQATAAPQSFLVEKLSIADASLIFEAEGAERISYSGVDVGLIWPDAAGPATVDATVRPAGSPVQVNATIGAFAGFVQGQVQPLQATIEAAGGRVVLDGRASTAGDVAGALAVNLPDTDTFLSALGLSAVGLPEKLGQSVNLTTQVTYTSDNRLALRDLAADLGGNSLGGAVDLDLNGTPTINAQLTAGALDLRTLTGSAPAPGGATTAATGTGATRTQTESGWPKDAIDASGLAAFNGEIALTAASIDLGQFKLGATRTLLRNDRSRMVFGLREVAAYGGTLTGEFVMNNRSGLSVGGNMALRGLSLQPFLTDAAEIDTFTGQADMDLKFLGIGQTVDTIMRSLSGNGSFTVAGGTIQGLDLDGLLKFGRGNGRTTVFERMGATYRMEGGNLLNDDLLVELRDIEARGSGRIGLGAQDIDYTFTPTKLKDDGTADVAIPVRIQGPWADPSIVPDLEAAIKLRFDDKIEAEKERLKARAKAKEDELKAKAQSQVRQKVAEELNVVDQGQSLEDAVKNKVEDKLKEGLRGLFD